MDSRPMNVCITVNIRHCVRTRLPNFPRLKKNNVGKRKFHVCWSNLLPWETPPMTKKLQNWERKESCRFPPIVINCSPEYGLFCRFVSGFGFPLADRSCVSATGIAFSRNQKWRKKIKHFQFKLKNKNKKGSENGSSQQEAEISSKKNILK